MDAIEAIKAWMGEDEENNTSMRLSVELGYKSNMVWRWLKYGGLTEKDSVFVLHKIEQLRKGAKK